jgi:hypothetical protein
MDWIEKLYFMEYCSMEHRHPQRSPYWDTELWVKYIDVNKKAHKVELIHTARVSWASAGKSIADAAYNALVYYHGRCYDAMQYGGLIYYPLYLLDESTEIIEVADATSPILQAQVELTCELVNKVSLEDEVLNERKLNEQERMVSDGLRAELDHPKLHEMILTPFIKKDCPIRIWNPYVIGTILVL